MYHLMIKVALVLLLVSLWQSVAHGQALGSREGADESHPDQGLRQLTREEVEGFTVIEGRAEIRVKPTEIRIVLGVTGEGTTAQECSSIVGQSLSKLKQAWREMEIPEANIVEDFIAVLPVYEWNIEKRGLGQVGLETKSGYRMQTNLHLAVPDDATADKAIHKAFETGITDIIAFDYWSNALEDVKAQARQQAVEAARGKSDLLLALFDERPSIINVQEKTTVRYPESLYESFENSEDEEYYRGRRDDLPYIRAFRPRNTYYRGLYIDGDIQPRELPMRPEISVISTVRLYFASSVKAAPTEQPQPE